MRKIRRFGLGLLGCLLSLGASAEDLDLSGVGDNGAAAVVLSRWLTDIGYTTSLKPGERQLDIVEGKFTILPKVSTSGVDRLVIYRYFKGKPSNAHSEELKEIVREINNRFNVCSAYVDDDGDLQMRFVVIFDDKLGPRLLRMSLEHVKTSVSIIISEYRPKFKPYYE